MLEWAREVLARTQTVEQLRQAQSVVLPLDYGLSLEQTARVIGRSVPWTCRLRNRFLAGEPEFDCSKPLRSHKQSPGSYESITCKEMGSGLVMMHLLQN
jgi:hypothetical protein